MFVLAKERSQAPVEFCMHSQDTVGCVRGTMSSMYHLNVLVSLSRCGFCCCLHGLLAVHAFNLWASLVGVFGSPTTPFVSDGFLLLVGV